MECLCVWSRVLRSKGETETWTTDAALRRDGVGCGQQVQWRPGYGIEKDGDLEAVTTGPVAVWTSLEVGQTFSQYDL